MKTGNFSKNRFEVFGDEVSSTGLSAIAVVLIIIFEGAVRKWFSSGFGSVLILTRDFLCVYCIYTGVSKLNMLTSKLTLEMLVFWSCGVIFWAMLQLIFGQGNITVAFMGIRFWLLYLWFAVIVGECLSEHELHIICKIIVLAIIFSAPLSIFQFSSPPGAYINQQVDGDEDKVFKLTGDIVRTTGFFSFTLGHSTLISISSPIILWGLAGGGVFRSKIKNLLSIISLVICVILSGSRSVFAIFAVQATIFVGAIFVAQKNEHGNYALISTVLLLLILIAVPIIFPDAIGASLDRIQEADDSEVLSDRLVAMVFGEHGILNGIKFLGYGLGAGTNIVGVMNGTFFDLGETEPDRIIAEGGILGIVFIVAKIILIFIGLYIGLNKLFYRGDVLAILLWITLAVALVSWSLIGQLSVNGLGFILLGLGIATLRGKINKLD